MVFVAICTIYAIGSGFVFSRYAIASVSMNPTLLHGDFVVSHKSVNSNAGWLTNLLKKEKYVRGDIIIFKHPQENEIYVKRIIAVPGDVVSFNGSELMINGSNVKRDIINEGQNNASFRWLKNELYYERNSDKHYKISLTGDSAKVSGELQVLPSHVFVMGDNRNQSIDSRFWGLLPEDNILETPLFISWSIEPGFMPDIRWDRIGNWVR